MLEWIKNGILDKPHVRYGKRPIRDSEDNMGSIKMTETRNKWIHTCISKHQRYLDISETYQKIQSAIKQIPRLQRGLSIIDTRLVKETIKKLKNRKSSGLNKIANKLIKYSRQELVKQLTIFFQKIFNNGTTSKEWK